MNNTLTAESCASTCRNCQKVCEETLAYCKEKGGRHTDTKHINLLEDCITACQTSVYFLSRKSENHMKSCAFCAEICNACADSCDAMADDEQMKKCADECRKCAQSCEKMAGEQS